MIERKFWLKVKKFLIIRAGQTGLTGCELSVLGVA